MPLFNKMKDKKTLLWIFKGSKSQLPYVFVIAMLRTLLTVLGVYFALSSKGVIDAASRKDRSEIIFASLLLVGIILVQLIIKLIGNALEERIRGRMEISFKSKLFKSILKKDYSKITAYHSGDLLTRIGSDINVVTEGVVSLLPGVMATIVGLVCAFFGLVSLDSTFAYIFLVGGLLLLLAISLFRTLMKNLHKAVQESYSKVRSFFQEAILSLLMIKVFSIEDYMGEKGDELQETVYKNKMKRRNISVLANTGMGFVFSFASLFALIRCSVRLFFGTITFGTLTAVLQLVNQIQYPIASLSSVFPRYFSILASAERIIEIEDLPDEKGEGKSLEKEHYEKLSQIVFDNISFSYGRDEVLYKTTCSIDKGDFIIISGISGIGKSTLMKLLLGVIYPQDGEIYLLMENGEKIFVGKHIRILFSYVPQGNLLLSGTIRESVSIVKPDATDEEIINASKVACAYDFIKELPEGLDTVIGEKGAGLSEGQVQRLAITRAILSSAPIILLDEATSALDEETEEKLLYNIKQLKNKTCVLISHKKAAYSVCNKEFKVENKKIVVNNIE